LPSDLRILQSLDLENLRRTPGTGVFVYALGEIDTNAFIRFITEQRTLPEQALLVRVVTTADAHVPIERQASSDSLGHGVYLTTIRFGYDDPPDVPLALAFSAEPLVNAPAITYYVSAERIPPRALDAMSPWQRWLFSLMVRRSESPANYYRIPARRTSRIA
jgi:KUP system potassium uptake protein